MNQAVSLNNTSSMGFLPAVNRMCIFPLAHLNNVLVVAKIACIYSRALCAKARVVYFIDLQASLQNL